MNNRSENTYTIKHWKVIELEDGIALEGHLHGREGYPEGIHIRTSIIKGYEETDNGIMFMTRNSRYLGAYEDYLFGSDTLKYLDCAKAPANTSEAQKKRELRYKSFLKDNRLPEAYILCWNGCECPYLKWTALLSRENANIHELTETRYQAAASIPLFAGGFLTMRGSAFSETALRLSDMPGKDCPVFIENTGEKALYFHVGNRAETVCVRPGEITQI